MDGGWSIVHAQKRLQKRTIPFFNKSLQNKCPNKNCHLNFSTAKLIHMPEKKNTNAKVHLEKAHKISIALDTQPLHDNLLLIYCDRWIAIYIYALALMFPFYALFVRLLFLCLPRFFFNIQALTPLFYIKFIHNNFRSRFEKAALLCHSRFREFLASKPLQHPD